MSLFPWRLRFERKASDIVRRIDLQDPNGLRGIGGGVGSAGAVVNARSALGLSAFWACGNLISGSISSLPCEIFRGGDTIGQLERSHPLYTVLHESPNYDQTPLDFWDFVSLSLETWGNAYARVERGADGRVIGLWPVPAEAVMVRRLTTGQLQYSFSQDGKSYVLLDRQMFHLRGPGGNPLGGMSTLSFACNALSMGLAAEESAAGMFREGLSPSAVIAFNEWLTPEQRAMNRKVLAEYEGTRRHGRAFVAEGGMTVSPISINPEDAQLLESRQFSVEEICRFFGVPPVMIGHPGGTTAWPSSVEQQVLMFVKFTLRRRLKRIEQAIRQQLLTPEDRGAGIFAKFNLEGLLRGDSAARASFYTSMSQIGGMTINEIRARENLAPVPGGDEPRVQMQVVPITQAGQGAK